MTGPYDPYNRRVNQVPLEQQRQSVPPYRSTPQPLASEPPTKLGQPIGTDFAVTTFDARPLNAYDGFWICHDAGAFPLDPGFSNFPGVGFVTPPGYTTIIRQLDITLSLSSNPPNVSHPSTGQLVDLFGFLGCGDFDAEMNWQYQITINGIPTPQLSSLLTGVPPTTQENAGKIPIMSAFMGSITVPTYIIVPENSDVTTLTTYQASDSIWAGVWRTTTVMAFNLLLNTGVGTQIEPLNKDPIPVSVSP